MQLTAALDNLQMYKVGRFETHALPPSGPVKQASLQRQELVVMSAQPIPELWVLRLSGVCEEKSLDGVVVHCRVCGAHYCMARSYSPMFSAWGTRKSCRVGHFGPLQPAPSGTMPWHLLHPDSD